MDKLSIFKTLTRVSLAILVSTVAVNLVFIMFWGVTFIPIIPSSSFIQGTLIILGVLVGLIAGGFCFIRLNKYLKVEFFKINKCDVETISMNSNKVYPDTKTTTTVSKGRNLGFLFISLFFSLVGALVYKYFTATFFNFVSIGLITASVNIFFYFGFVYRYKVKTGDEFFDNNIILIAGGFTLIIPYFIFYTLFSLLFSGFKTPFAF